MTVHGTSLIAGRQVRGGGGSMRATDPSTGEQLEPEFCFAGSEEVEEAARAAAAAFDAYRATRPDVRAAFLARIAENLAATRDETVQRAHCESGLPVPRLLGEHDRTVNQLRLFARELRLGDHHGVRIDGAQPGRRPAPARDIRQRQIPLGPVLVFGASNFPLAFSPAGGDTAGALAAGCPVIVKGHNSHAGTAELAGQAIARAVDDLQLPPGIFSLVFGPGTTIGQELAAHPAIKAIAFTGSRAGGTALMRTAAARTEPVPVYAEMSSINPVVLLPGALAEDTDSLAGGFVASLTLASGQFCTNPGLLLLPADAEAFTAEVAARVARTGGQTMLSTGIGGAYREGLARLEADGARRVSTGREGAGQNAPPPALFRTSAEHLRATPGLQDEVFGAAALLVGYDDLEDLERTLECLQGQLTITVHAAATDRDTARTLLPVLERRAGRIVVNDWPTGVEVTDAMVHGGPFPATSDSRTTSVGTLAIQRFLRPVSYQGLPPDLMPEPVHPDNPWGLPRRVDGELTVPA